MSEERTEDGGDPLTVDADDVRMANVPSEDPESEPLPTTSLTEEPTESRKKTRRRRPSRPDALNGLA